jgi:3',5'-cyclic AMP phosphodiesterase CpdA
MKLQIISDLHFEWLSPKEIYNEIAKIALRQGVPINPILFEKEDAWKKLWEKEQGELNGDKRADKRADVLVIAGDLCSYRNIWWILNEFSKYYEHVIYVNGNHELYGTHIDVVREQRNRQDDHKINDNVH